MSDTAQLIMGDITDNKMDQIVKISPTCASPIIATRRLVYKFMESHENYELSKNEFEAVSQHILKIYIEV